MPQPAQRVTYPFRHGLSLMLRYLSEELPVEREARYEFPYEDAAECMLQLDKIHYSHRQLKYSFHGL